MNAYLSVTIKSFTIWVMSAIINGFLCGIYLRLFGNEEAPLAEVIVISGIFSLFFAVPGVFIFWILMLSFISRKLFGRPLFRAGLSAAIILAIATAFFLTKLFSQKEIVPISICIVVSAIASVMMHFNSLIKIGLSTSAKI